MFQKELLNPCHVGLRAQNKTKQSKTNQNKTKQNKTKQNKTKQNKTKQNKTKPPAQYKFRKKTTHNTTIDLNNETK